MNPLRRKIMKAIFYAIATDDDGLYIDYMYFGGVVNTDEEAEVLTYSLVNDEKLDGAVFVKAMPMDSISEIGDLSVKVLRHFKRMSEAVYDLVE